MSAVVAMVEEWSWECGTKPLFWALVIEDRGVADPLAQGLAAGAALEASSASSGAAPEPRVGSRSIISLGRLGLAADQGSDFI